MYTSLSLRNFSQFRSVHETVVLKVDAPPLCCFSCRSSHTPVNLACTAFDRLPFVPHVSRLRLYSFCPHFVWQHEFPATSEIDAFHETPSIRLLHSIHHNHVDLCNFISLCASPAMCTTYVDRTMFCCSANSLAQSGRFRVHYVFCLNTKKFQHMLRSIPSRSTIQCRLHRPWPTC